MSGSGSELMGERRVDTGRHRGPMRQDAPMTDRSGAAEHSPRSGAVTDPSSPTATPRTGIPFQGVAIVGIGLALSQAISMVQMLVVARVLAPIQYGVFGAMAVIIRVGSTCLAATQVVVARQVASGREHERPGALSVLVVGAVPLAITAAVAPLIGRALDLDGVRTVLLVGATFVPFAITGAQLGALQGAERHLRLGGLYVVSTAARVTGGIVGAVIGHTADAALAGLALGAGAGAALGQAFVVDRPTWRSSDEATRAFLGEVLHAAHALVALAFLTSIDVLIARARLSPYEAGLYAAGALVARAAFFLPQSILIASFPRMVAGVGKAQRHAVLAVAAVGAVTTAAVAATPWLVVMVMSGRQYLEVVPDAWLFALEGSGFAVVQVLLYARMANHDRRAAALLWVGGLALTAVGLSLGTSVHALVTCACVAAWTVALLGLALNRVVPAHRAPAPVTSSGATVT